MTFQTININLNNIVLNAMLNEYENVSTKCLVDFRVDSWTNRFFIDDDFKVTNVLLKPIQKILYKNFKSAPTKCILLRFYHRFFYLVSLEIISIA
jgi:hypothetical protein